MGYDISVYLKGSIPNPNPELFTEDYFYECSFGFSNRDSYWLIYEKDLLERGWVKNPEQGLYDGTMVFCYPVGRSIPENWKIKHEEIKEYLKDLLNTRFRDNTYATERVMYVLSVIDDSCILEIV